jgi:hypothetical protein
VKAQETEELGTEVKLNKLLDVVQNEGLRDDQTTKLLIFTEHKDTLDFLVEKLRADFDVAVIHGGMKLGERIASEREFRERAQIMVATEAAGEGINLQFCHLMMNYDIPWNPNRLEQRMGRIHRIGQTRDVHIYSLVATNTREGHVLATLLRKMENMGRALGDEVFDVIGETFAGYRLKDLIEQVIAGELSQEAAAEAIGGEQVDPPPQALDSMQYAPAHASAGWNPRNHASWRSSIEVAGSGAVAVVRAAVIGPDRPPRRGAAVVWRRQRCGYPRRREAARHFHYSMPQNR